MYGRSTITTQIIEINSRVGEYFGFLLCSLLLLKKFTWNMAHRKGNKTIYIYKYSQCRITKTKGKYDNQIWEPQHLHTFNADGKRKSAMRETPARSYINRWYDLIGLDAHIYYKVFTLALKCIRWLCDSCWHSVAI